MPRIKSSRNDSEKLENKKIDLNIQYRLAKDLIRACHGRMADTIIINLINQGVLGVELDSKGVPKKDDNGTIITIKISDRTYYRWKSDALSLETIQNDFTDFVKIDYAIQVAGIKSLLEVLVNIMFRSVMGEQDSFRQATLAHRLFTDLPLFTQFLDIEKRAIQHGKISLKDKRNETSSLVSSN